MNRHPTKKYRAIVWIEELPGERVTVQAKDATEAMALLTARYGEEAVISAWDDDDASRPRR